MIRFQPFFNISYTSHVTLVKPYLVTALCKGIQIHSSTFIHQLVRPDTSIYPTPPMLPWLNHILSQHCVKVYRYTVIIIIHQLVRPDTSIYPTPPMLPWLNHILSQHCVKVYRYTVITIIHQLVRPDTYFQVYLSLSLSIRLW